MSTDTVATTEIRNAVVRFAGDSGDGMQTVGEQFTDSSALSGNDVRTFPDFPAEIRAPAGTLPGVSGFQIQFGSQTVLTPGDSPDALVAMNPAALKVNINDLNKRGLLVVNENAFTPANLKLSAYETDPLLDPALEEDFQVVKIKITDMTKEALKDSPLKPSEKTRCKNFFALGFMYWVYGRPLEHTEDWIKSKWKNKDIIVEANIAVLRAGYYYGETSEIMRERFEIRRAPVEPGIYRKITGNEALVLGLIAAADRCGKELLFSGYPITPASSVLEMLSKYKNFRVKTVQAEDEISAIGVALGGSFAGNLGATATSGPGVCLKGEFMGLAVITELPLLILDIQRGGPSTGLPTKTEQADLLMALYGRHGESPMPVLAPNSPGDCFNTVIEAARIAIEYSTPVLVLSDGSLANGAEPWKVPNVEDIPHFSAPQIQEGDDYVIYKRDPETLARKIAYPGQKGYEHRIGGLEKSEDGGVSYDPENHEKMTELRAAKVAGIAKSLPAAEVDGDTRGRLLVLGWGSTFGSIKTAVDQLRVEGETISFLHLRHLNPFPPNLIDILKGFDRILIPELNCGQLSLLIRNLALLDVVSFTKIQGKPFTVSELKAKMRETLKR